MRYISQFFYSEASEKTSDWSEWVMRGVWRNLCQVLLVGSLCDAIKRVVLQWCSDCIQQHKSTVCCTSEPDLELAHIKACSWLVSCSHAAHLAGLNAVCLHMVGFDGGLGDVNSSFQKIKERFDALIFTCVATALFSLI